MTRRRRGRVGTAAATAAKDALRAYGIATATRRRPPELLVIGAKRGGTTSLWRYLGRHPGVLPTFPARAQIKGTYYFDEQWQRGDRWYRSHFPTDGERRRVASHLGYQPIAYEASPYYLYHPHAPQRARRTTPDALIVALLRDPVERAYSHHKERRNHTETATFADAVEAEATRTAGEADRVLADPTYVSASHRHQTYLDQGRYAPMLERWYAAFDPSQVIVAASEEFFADPQALCTEITDRLGLPAHGLGPTEAINAEPSPAMDPALEAGLRAALRPDIDAVEQVLGRSMPWPR